MSPQFWRIRFLSRSCISERRPMFSLTYVFSYAFFDILKLFSWKVRWRVGFKSPFLDLSIPDPLNSTGFQLLNHVFVQTPNTTYRLLIGNTELCFHQKGKNQKFLEGCSLSLIHCFVFRHFKTDVFHQSFPTFVKTGKTILA